MTKTTNYQLNQWAKSDRIRMDDFNADNQKLDAALAGKAVGLFGSYGWAPLNMKVMQRYFDESGIETVASYNVNFVPTEEKLKEITSDLASKL